MVGGTKRQCKNNMGIIKKLKEIRKSKDSHFLFVDSKVYFRYKLIIKLFIYLNKNYIGVEIFRKDYKYHGDIVVVALRYYGKNVKRRTNGYAKDFVEKNPGAKCIYSGILLTKQNATADHIIPISKGGNNTKVNLIVCSKFCNAERGDRDFYEYLRSKNCNYKNLRRPFI